MGPAVPLIAEDDLDPIFTHYIAERRKIRDWVPNNVYALANAPDLGRSARGVATKQAGAGLAEMLGCHCQLHSQGLATKMTG